MEAFPLHWPPNYKRTKYSNRSRFGVSSFARVRDGLFAELKRLGARKVILSTNIPLTNAGIPYGRYSVPNDKGVAVYFEHKGKSMCFACDLWDRIEDNIQSILKTIEALRGIERWGASDMLDRAFTGFAALSAPVSGTWWEILGVSKDCNYGELKGARNTLAKKYHPDSGTNPDQSMMAKVNEAFERAEKDFFGKPL